jgi:ribosomal protein S18 acetylase RimI-like enzyme
MRVCSSGVQLSLVSPAPAESAEVAALLRRVFGWAYGAAIPPVVLERFLAAELSDSAVADDLQRSQVLYRAALVDGALAGISRLAVMPPPGGLPSAQAIELAKCYVLPEYHGMGVADALLRDACDLARTAGYRWIWLCVWEQNPRAVAFYRRHGFRTVGRTPIFVEDVCFDDLLMLRGLDD